MEYRFILEPYSTIKSRYRCPNCGKNKVFSKYVDTKNNTYLDDRVGRCNREIKCGYHYTPKQYFEDNICKTHTFLKERPGQPIRIKPAKSIINTIPYSVLEKSKRSLQTNNFIIFLQKILSKQVIEDLKEKYHIGVSKKWEGATVFWQVDINQNIRSGKIMLYNPQTGKRVKKPFSHISWVHKALNLEAFNLKQCFFGEHLLKTNLNKPIAIVESEKTAVISSIFLSEFIWIATGSLSNLNYENTKVLKGRQVVLFPDLNGYQLWNTKINSLYPEVDYQISDLLEKKASESQKKKGWDIADYLIGLHF